MLCIVLIYISHSAPLVGNHLSQEHSDVGPVYTIYTVSTQWVWKGATMLANCFSAEKVLEFEFAFDWECYALSAFKAIFGARTYDCITYLVR